MTFVNRVIGTHLNRFRVTRIGYFFKGDIFRDIDHDRAGATAARNMKGFFQGYRQIACVLHQKIMFHHGARNAHRIAFLKRVKPDSVSGNLSGHNDQGNTVHVGGGNAGHSVGNTRSRGDQRDADVASGTRITIGSVHSGLLVTDQNMPDSVLLVKSIVNVQHGTTRVPPDVLDAFSLQGFDENLCTPKL